MVLLIHIGGGIIKFYIASSFQNKEKVKELSKILKQNGNIHSYDWTQNDRATSIESLHNIGEKEKNGVMDSDFLVVLLPGGKGTHIELGIALGLGKRIYLYSPNDEINDYEKTSTFYHVEGVNQYVGFFDSFIEYVCSCEHIAMEE